MQHIACERVAMDVGGVRYPDRLLHTVSNVLERLGRRLTDRCDDECDLHLPVHLATIERREFSSAIEASDAVRDASTDLSGTNYLPEDGTPARWCADLGSSGSVRPRSPTN